MPDLDETRLRAAHEYAKELHGNNFRYSGEPFIAHLLAVCDIVLSLRPDESTLVAAFFHDISKGERYSFEDLQKRFGEDVSALVTGLEKINTVSLRTANTEAESLRKMFLSMAGDIRVVLIRMAERLHNMETLDFVSESKRKRIARETLEIYVPIAERLGIYKIKWALEDLAFKYLHPHDYEDLRLQLQQYMKQQLTVMDHIQNELKTYLHARQIQAKVEGRLKNLYSIYKKMKRKNRTALHEIFDVFAIRIILPTRFNDDGEETTEHLYALLGLIHNKWFPLSNRFKDYVALPKPNGYKSLHTTVLGLTPKPLDQPTEIQIRSEKMHQESHFGIASHWLYKEKKSFFKQKMSEKLVQDLSSFDEDTFTEEKLVKGFARLQQDLSGESQKIRPMKVDLFEDRIFVLTPGGDIKDLPKGSTPIDFAYAIHTEVGHRCQGAKVNNAIVPLDYQLKNGEIVDILLKNKPDPKPHWLSFVKTAQARAKIKSHLKSLDYERSIREGKNILNRFLSEAGYPLLDDTLSILRKFENKKLSFKDRETILGEIGNGTLLPQAVIRKIFGSHVQSGLLNAINQHPDSQNVSKVQARVPASTTAVLKGGQIFVAGEANVPYKFSLCCKPKKGDPVLAYISRGKAVRIHLQSCKVLKNVDQARTLQASWTPPGLESRRRFSVKIMVTAADRVGLIRDIADVVASFNINIVDFALQERKGHTVRRRVILEVADEQQYQKMVERLKRVRSVLEIKQLDE